MLMANNEAEANEIYSLNTAQARNVIKQRQHDIKNQKGSLSFKEFQDVKQDRAMNATNQGIKTIRGMKGK